MTRSICGTIKQCWAVVTEAVCSHHSHLYPVSEEHVVFKHSNSKRMRRLGCSFKNYFPGEEQPGNVYPGQVVHAFLFQAAGQDVWPPPSPVQTMVGDRLHCVEVAVRPVDPLVDNVQSDSRGSAKSVLHQFYAVTAIHERTFQPHILIGVAHVCEEHIAANARKKKKMKIKTMGAPVG